MPKRADPLLSRRRKHKTKTERVDEVMHEALAQEDYVIDPIIAKLNPEEQLLFHQLRHSLEVGDDSDEVNLESVYRIDYLRRPPTAEEFVMDPYFLGNTHLPAEDNPGFWPVWKDIFCRDFNLDSTVHNVVLTGSLGGGKTNMAVTIFSYRLACARLLRNPGPFFGLSRGSKIYYIILSLTKSVVAETAFGDIQTFMGLSPFFREECGFDPDSKYSGLRIELGHDIVLTAGSKGQHMIGRNAMGVFMDEGNFRLEMNPDMSAYAIYDQARARIKNRFQRFEGFLPAISVLASSARDESSMTEQVIDEIEKAKDPTTQVVYRFAIYNVHPDIAPQVAKDRWFKVQYGLKNREPVLLRGWYDKDGNPLPDGSWPDNKPGVPNEVEEKADGSRTVLVPRMYLDRFQVRVKDSLQGLAGISTGGSNKLFTSSVTLEQAIETGEAEGLANPAKKGIPTEMPVSEENDLEVWDHLEHKAFLTKRMSNIEARHHPGNLRFAHIDLATQTYCGIAVCHLVGQRLVNDIKAGKPFAEYRQVVQYDFILTITSGANRPISLEKVQKFIFWLRDQCHMRFGLVTCDQYQSDMPLQMLQSRGVNVAKLSLDRHKAPYIAWRNGFEESRIIMYRQPRMLAEAEALMDGPDKIDHPPQGTKDTTDAAAGAYYNAINYKEGVAVATSNGFEPGIYTSMDESSETPVVSLQTKPAPETSQPLVFSA